MKPIINKQDLPEFVEENGRKYPVIARKRGWVATDYCPFCKKTHFHFPGEGHRVALCNEKQYNNGKLFSIAGFYLSDGTLVEPKDGYVLMEYGRIQNKKTKTYPLMIAKTFPKGHIREGEETKFIFKIFNCYKIHTIRSNYELWEKRFKTIATHENAVLSLRTWEGKPYNSKQEQGFLLTVEKDQIGLQKLTFTDTETCVIDGHHIIRRDELAENDGLSLEDFNSWFKKAKIGEPYALIHFTDYRYGNFGWSQE